MSFSIFDTILILLAVSIATSSIFQKLNIPVIVGYIAVGIVLGPHAAGVMGDDLVVRDLAEFGLVFLMFNIGLEFSFSKLLHMKRAVFVYGGLEVLIAILVTTTIGYYLSMTIAQAFIVGSIVAMSSTAIVVKQLSTQRQLLTKHGENSVGILLFQDLAVIPILILVPSLGQPSSNLNIELLQALGKASLAIVGIYLLGRLVLRPVFFMIAKMKNLEVFTLSALFVALGSAWATHEIGLSMTLGAFMAGMMLGETEFRHQIENDIRPFRDVLVGFFFITVGLQFNTKAALEFWPWVLILFMALVVFKTILVFSLGKLLRLETQTAMRTSVILAHGGEFGFAILTLALTYELLPPDYGQVTLAALLLSMLVAPIVTRHSNKISQWITFSKQPDDLTEGAPSLENHVVIGGYGRVGRYIAKLLQPQDIPFIGFDLDPKKVREAQAVGYNVFYADLTQHDVFEKARLDSAAILVLSFNDTLANIKIIEQVRVHFPKLTIIARAHDSEQAAKLKDHGATIVVPELLEASLAMASQVLSLMGVEPAKAEQISDECRSELES